MGTVKLFAISTITLFDPCQIIIASDEIISQPTSFINGPPTITCNIVCGDFWTGRSVTSYSILIIGGNVIMMDVGSGIIVADDTVFIRLKSIIAYFTFSPLITLNTSTIFIDFILSNKR